MDVSGSPLDGFTKNVSYRLDRPLTPLVLGAAAITIAVVALVAVVTADDDPLPARYAGGNGDDEAITSEPPEERDATPQAVARW